MRLVTRSGRARCWLGIGVWTAALAIGAVDLVHVVNTYWMGADSLPTVKSVAALFSHRPIWVSYVYPPGLLLMFSPLALLQQGRTGEDLILLLEVVGLVYAIFAMFQLTSQRLFSPRTGLLALMVALSGQVVFALQLANLTVALIPLSVAFYTLLGRRRWLTAGLVLGVSLTVKPMLLPLAALLLLERQWKATAVAIGVPVLTSAIVVAFMYKPIHYLHVALAQLFSNDSRNDNINLSSVGDLWGVNGALVDTARVLVVAATICIAVRVWLSGAPVMARYVWVSEALIAGLLLSFVFAHSYYALLLLPAGLMSPTMGRASTRWGGVIAMALTLLPFDLGDHWWALSFPGDPLQGLAEWPGLTDRVTTTLVCAGMLLMLAAAGTVGAGPSSRRSPRRVAEISKAEGGW